MHLGIQDRISELAFFNSLYYELNVILSVRQP